MDDQVDQNMEKDQHVSLESSDIPPSNPSKVFLKLKISNKTLKRCGQHICSVCSKGFSSGKALGGHIRIHMKGNKNGRHRMLSKLHQQRNLHRSKAKKRISKDADLPRASAEVDDLPLKNTDHQEGNNNNTNTEEKAICCICNKDFRSMKSLFGHMRNHPERGWRGIRPPPSDKTSCCSSVSDEKEEAMEVVDQISGATEGSDLLKSLPKWSNTYATAKRCGKFISDEIPEAAYCLMKLSRGESFHSGAADKPMVHRSRSSSLAYKAPEEKGKDRVKIELHQERVPSDHCKLADSYGSGEEQKLGKSWAKELNYDNFMVREKKTKLNYGEDATKVVKKNLWFDRFQKFPTKADEEEERDASAMEGRHSGGKKIGTSSQTPGFYPKNPSSGGLFGAPSSNETASPAEGKHLHSKKQFPSKRGSHKLAAEGSHQVCSPKLLDFDLNEPYVALDAETTGPY